MNKLVKDNANDTENKALIEELDLRIAELKRMRDGAEMDLDLDITQRMLENDEADVVNMQQVLKEVSVACDMLEDENVILGDELQF